MNILLNKVVPQFLEKEKIIQSQIWEHEHVFTQGQNIQIVAPSGSGKTSLIHFLYGMRHDYDGQILMNEQNVKTISPIQIAAMRATTISIVFQDLRLFANHTALNNIEIKKDLAPYHTTPRIQAMAVQLGIANKLGQHAGTCSYGEQQRIAIIRALQQPFNFIIMDEPFSHLDEANSKLAMQLIQQEAAERGAGIILADLHPIPFFNADKILHL